MSWLERITRVASLRTWAIILGGPFLLAYSVWIVWLVAFHPLPADQASRRLDILGKSNWAALALLAIIIIALAAIARVNVRGLGGTGIEIDNGGNDSSAGRGS